MKIPTVYLSAIGTKGGISTSQAKAAAARENGKKGGRPRGGGVKGGRQKIKGEPHRAAFDQYKKTTRLFNARFPRSNQRRLLSEYLELCIGHVIAVNTILGVILANPDQIEADRLSYFARRLKRTVDILKAAKIRKQLPIL